MSKKNYNTSFIELFKALTLKTIQDNKNLPEHEKRNIILLPEVAEQILTEIDDLKC